MKRSHAVVIAVLVVAGVLLAFASGVNEPDPIYVVFTIDTERDVPPLLEGSSGIEKGIPLLLSLFEEHGVRATFLVTGHVAENYPDVVQQIAYDHEVGCHGMYHDVALSSLGYQEKVERIEEATAIIASVTGSKPTSFRAPGHSCDTEVIRILEGLGYTVEASCYQGDSYPYHPSWDDWTEVGDMNMLRIPASNAPDYFYPFYYHDTEWSIPFEHVINMQNDRPETIVVIGLHPWELCNFDLPEEYGAIEESCGPHTYQRLVAFLEYLHDKNVEYVTLAEAYELLISDGAS
ncbi:hypothetical protein EF808_04210 [archaeon]|nr:MAG: hypothetical protein EF808_04210 [archaeon]